MKSADEEPAAVATVTGSVAPSSKQRRVQFLNAAYLEDAADPTDVRKPNSAARTKSEAPYDPHEHGNKNDATSLPGTVVHVLILVAGPATLTIPGMYGSAGYALALVLTPLLIYLYVHAATMIVRSEYELCTLMRIPQLSYPDVVYQAFVRGPTFGRPAATGSRRLTYAVFFIVWFGYCCFNYVLMCENMRTFVAFAFRTRLPANAFLVGLWAPLTLLSLIRQQKYLVPLSTLANLLNVVCLLLVVYYAFADPTPWSVPSAVGHLSNVPLLVGSILFDLNISGILMPLKNAMKEPKKFASRCGALTLSFGITCSVYTCFSSICVMKYGAAIQPSVLQNVPLDRLPAQVGLLLSTLSLFLHYPLVIFVPFDIIWNQNLKSCLNSAYPTAWEYGLRTAIVAAAFAASIAVPNIFLFISLGGTVCTSIDSLILPAAVHSMVTWKSSKSTVTLSIILAKNMAIVILASILVVTGSYDCVTQIANYYIGRPVGPA